MAAGLLICFTVFNGFFELQPGDGKSSLIMTVLLIMTPTVFFAVQRIFDWGDQIAAKLKRKRKRK